MTSGRSSGRGRPRSDRLYPVVSLLHAGAARAEEPAAPRPVSFTGSPTGYPADSCTEDRGPELAVLVKAGQRSSFAVYTAKAG